MRFKPNFIKIKLLFLLFMPLILLAKLQVKVVDDCVKLRLADKVPDQPFIFNAQTATINIHGARNEVVAFQIILISDEATHQNLNLEASPLLSQKGLIEQQHLQFFRAWYLEVSEPSSGMYGNPSSTGPGWYPDPLLPFQTAAGAVGTPFQLQANQQQAIWVDVYIPDNTPAGIYRGSIRIAEANTLIHELELQLQVWHFVLSDTTHFKTFFYFGPEQIRLAHHTENDYARAERLYCQYLQMAHQHRINLATDIAVTGNWQYFDRVWGPYLDGTAFTSGPGKNVGCKLWPVYISIYEGKAHFQEQATLIMQHYLEKGWTDQAFFYPIDEPDPDQYSEVRKIGGWLDNSPYPGNLLPLMLTEPLVTELLGYIDIWDSPRIRLAEIATRQGSGERFWTYNGGEPGAGNQIIDTDGWALRSWPWIALKGKREAWHYWDCCYFRDRVNGRGETDVWKNPITYDQRPKGEEDWGNGDGTLFYPGQQHRFARNFVDGPVSSFRMKALRRGLQDYEYLWLAQHLGLREQVNSIVQQVLPHPVLGDAIPGKTCYVKSAEKWHQARLSLAEMIQQASRKSAK